MAHHVSKTRFGELVERAIAELPEQFAAFLDEVPIEIRQRPSKEMLKKLGLREDELLLGLYTGQSLLDRSVMDMVRMPNVIFIFQEDVELVSDSEADLVREIRTTVLHEIGHHFGMDEADLDELGYG